MLSRVGWDEENGQDRSSSISASGAAYAVYNWELFFHIPLYIAELLSQNQKFEDALKWYHYIFDPTLAERRSGAASASGSRSRCTT